MVLVGGLFAFGLVLAIAAFVVVREAGRLAEGAAASALLHGRGARVDRRQASRHRRRDPHRSRRAPHPRFPDRVLPAQGRRRQRLDRQAARATSSSAGRRRSSTSWSGRRRPARSTCPSRCTRWSRPSSRTCGRSAPSVRGRVLRNPVTSLRERDRFLLPDLVQTSDRRKEVVQSMHDKSGTSEVRGR